MRAAALRWAVSNLYTWQDAEASAVGFSKTFMEEPEVGWDDIDDVASRQAQQLRLLKEEIGHPAVDSYDFLERRAELVEPIHQKDQLFWGDGLRYLLRHIVKKISNCGRTMSQSFREMISEILRLPQIRFQIEADQIETHIPFDVLLKKLSDSLPDATLLERLDPKHLGSALSKTR
ncbi:MAG: hypothetical protein HY791_12570 [Deltaproteobacteria bacterium]|nr:hypothetical protein [Deltaproteobacteria bacterium]